MLKLSHSRIFLYSCRIVAIILTYRQVTENIRNYYKYESTLSQRDYVDQNLPFPNILICSKSMHSRMKRKYIMKNPFLYYFIRYTIFTIIIVDLLYPNISMKYIRHLYGYGIAHTEKFGWIGCGNIEDIKWLNWSPLRH